jgi:hypothetical protein
MRSARPLVPCLVLLVVAACTRNTSTTVPPASEVTPTPAGSSTVDPLVPYSPSPTPFTERTSGFIPDTLTLPSSDGTKLAITPVTTTMTLTFVRQARALVVYLDVQDRGDAPWSGVLGAEAQVTDASGGVFPAEEAQRGDLHPDPARYGGSNRSLLHEVTVQPRKTVSGALVFHVTGGNRPITLRMSVDGGTTWGEWATNLGTF